MLSIDISITVLPPGGPPVTAQSLLSILLSGPRGVNGNCQAGSVEPCVPAAVVTARKYVAAPFGPVRVVLVPDRRIAGRGSVRTERSMCCSRVDTWGRAAVRSPDRAPARG